MGTLSNDDKDDDARLPKVRKSPQIEVTPTESSPLNAESSSGSGLMVKVDENKIDQLELLITENTKKN